uniref:4-hydroxythreonine-4-phosphate dehydrogenase PdxA n=1 Tax=candidate division WOR-3 bacterium TaxID=2052148 RepID=A0A7C4U810_UNCW3
MLVITLGDPGGISYEVFLKSCSLLKKNDIVIGSLSALNYYSSLYSIKIPEWLNIYDIKGKFLIGKDAKSNGEIAYHSLLKGLEIIKKGGFKGLVTLPVSKRAINLAGYKFKGHTDTIAEYFGVKDYGMLMLGRINVYLLTTHIPLKNVHKFIKKDYIVRKVMILHKFFKERFHIEPRIIIMGLNPHSGEGGIIGDEELNEIEPAIRELRRKGVNVLKVVPADTFFLERGFDVIVSMYHDQGMIPFKYTSFFKGVNITIGIPFIRTSPAHGVGYDIAGKGIASHKSTEMAIRLARKICFS